MKTYIGIDNGLSGGIAVIYPDGQTQAWAMPVIADGSLDEPEIVYILEEHQDPFCVIERVSCMPAFNKAKGVRVSKRPKTTLTEGVNHGLLRGMLAALSIPYQIVSPKEWQKVMLAGENCKGRDEIKAASIRVAKRLFPHQSLLRTEKCTKPHDGMAEALLMAEYGRRTRG